jgi:ABC-type uncharacterized transport system substrate-binding protein
MKRRQFITLLGGAAAWPLAARAQQPSTSPPKRPIIGFLAGGSKVANERYYSGFPEGMRGFGYLEGRDYAFEGRYAEGVLTRLPLLAEELIRLKPDVLLAGPTVAVVAANQVTASVPIVGINITDPVGRGLAASHARPGGNVTGILTRIEGLPGKQLEIAHDLLPAISKIGALVNPIDPSTGVQQRETDAAAAKFGVSLVRAEARAPGELGRVLINAQMLGFGGEAEILCSTRALPVLTPLPVFGSIHATCLSALVTDWAMETWYHPSIA